MAVSGICMTAAVLYGRPAIKNTGAKKSTEILNETQKIIAFSPNRDGKSL
jgi:hypothetical protein